MRRRPLLVKHISLMRRWRTMFMSQMGQLIIWQRVCSVRNVESWDMEILKITIRTWEVMLVSYWMFKDQSGLTSYLGKHLKGEVPRHPWDSTVFCILSIRLHALRNKVLNNLFSRLSFKGVLMRVLWNSTGFEHCQCSQFWEILESGFLILDAQNHCESSLGW